MVIFMLNGETLNCVTIIVGVLLLRLFVKRMKKVDKRVISLILLIKEKSLA